MAASSYCVLVFPNSADMILQLKQEFDIVKELRGISGFGWDDERKVVTASPEVWEPYLEVSDPSPGLSLELIAGGFRRIRKQSHGARRHSRYMMTFPSS
jgi:hypothetical protein